MRLTSSLLPSLTSARKPWIPAELKLSLRPDKDLDVQEFQGGAKWVPQQVEVNWMLDLAIRRFLPA